MLVRKIKMRLFFHQESTLEYEGEKQIMAVYAVKYNNNKNLGKTVYLYYTYYCRSVASEASEGTTLYNETIQPTFFTTFLGAP